jgi:uncharacterized protein (DUF3084 family)
LGILTKICIVVLVVLVLLACPIFISQATVVPNYRKHYNDMKAKADLAAISASHASLAAQRSTLERDEAVAKLTQSHSAMQEEVNKLTADLAAEKQRGDKLQTNLDSIVAELTKLRADYESNSKRTVMLAKQRDEAFEKIEALTDESRRLSDQLKQAQLDNDHQAQYVRTLREQLVERDDRIKQLEQQIGPGAVAGKAEKPVTAETRISGTVTAVKGELASINVGSAKGVKQGMQLIIYRGANYVAKLRVEQVDVGASAGMILDKALDPAQGDKVADSLD